MHMSQIIKKWLNVFSNFKIDENTILGHSCGAGFIVRYLSENNIKVGDVFSGSMARTDKTLNTNFFDFKIDQSLINKIKSMNIIYSIDDDTDVLESVNKITEEVASVNVIKFENKNILHLAILKLGSF